MDRPNIHNRIWPGTPKSGLTPMNVFPIRTSTGAAYPSLLRLWILPFLAGGLILANAIFADMNNVQVTMIAALAIVIVGIPHGTLDIEIATARFGRSSGVGKLTILAGYLSCAAGMALCWMLAPALALTLFLVISIVHFGLDWRGGADPFLAMMVGWALIALPALSPPDRQPGGFNNIRSPRLRGRTGSAWQSCFCFLGIQE
jgi:beta-carotene 15,15'-dioxygenase